MRLGGLMRGQLNRAPMRPNGLRRAD
eukprot:IDg7446t1